MFYQRIETSSRNCGHSCKYGETRQWSESIFPVQPRIVVPEDKKDHEDGREAEGYGQAGTEKDACYYGKRTHWAYFTHGVGSHRYKASILRNSPLIEGLMPSSLGPLGIGCMSACGPWREF